ncbi:MAG: hypothetical protein VYA72_01130 [Bacteroidota bacterium]|nr:hypothetical protein [Bacteroidota bacterium]
MRWKASQASLRRNNPEREDIRAGKASKAESVAGFTWPRSFRSGGTITDGASGALMTAVVSGFLES